MDEVSTLISGLDFKVRKLIERQKKLRTENESLITEINRLKKTEEEQNQIIQGFEEKIHALKLARVTGQEADNSDTRARIGELIREIDKCIGLLNT